MAVESIKKYKQQNGDDTLKVILKSTKPFPNGVYFYCDASDEKLVRQHSWLLQSQKKPYVVATEKTYSHQTLRFHREKASNILNYYPDCINHINMVEFDNVNRNLDVVNQQQNRWCTPSKGYVIRIRSFVPHVVVNSRLIQANYVHSEVEAIQSTYLLEMQYEDYHYSFLKDRRHDLDILDLERTGRITEEEAVYRHVCRYAADNAWYYYRYDLVEYFREYHLSVPVFCTDSDGFMIHPITGQRLCPL